MTIIPLPPDSLNYNVSNHNIDPWYKAPLPTKPNARTFAISAEENYINEQLLYPRWSKHCHNPSSNPQTTASKPFQAVYSHANSTQYRCNHLAICLIHCLSIQQFTQHQREKHLKLTTITSNTARPQHGIRNFWTWQKEIHRRWRMQN